MAGKHHEQEVTLEDAYRLAVNHMNVGNFRVAELTLRDILAAVPDHYDSMYLLAMALYRTGNIKEALNFLGQVTDQGEPNVQWLSDYGVLLNEDGRQQEAITAFDRALAIEPKNAMVLWNKCYAHWLMDDYEMAEAAGKKAVNVAPDSAEAWLNYGAALARLEKHEQAIEAWEKALALRPDFAFAWNNLGNALRDLGRLEEAEEKCLKALDLEPNYPEALSNLGNVYHDRGDYENAEKYYRLAIANRPDYAEAHNNLCVALMTHSRYEEAVMHGRYAVSFRPNYGEAYMNLCDALRNLGHVDEARKAIEQAVILQPESAEVHMELADVLLMQDRYGDAEVALNRAEELKPESPRVYIKLSSVLERANKIDEALKAVDKAVQMNPEAPQAHLRKGRIYLLDNRLDETEKNYKKALELSPNAPGVLLALADMYLTIGELKKAEKYVEKARPLATNMPQFYDTLTHLKTFTKDDDDFKAMRALEKNVEARGLEQATSLHFALFSAYEDIGDYKKAFEHLKKANDYKRRLVPYQPAVQRHAFARIKETYTPATIEALQGKGYNSKAPVFIVGMPRSGTTLTEQIISAHPDVYGAGELSVLSRIERESGGVNAENCRALGEKYVKAVKKLDKSRTAKRITDKMPGNFTHIALIRSILPQAKIIHCRRNPIDNCLSCYKQNFARGQYWSYQLDELAEQHNLYRDLMAYWRELLPDQFLEIDYEETVANFEEQARTLIDFVGLPWDKACLKPHKNKRAVLTASKTQVIKPVYQSSVKGWKRYEKQLKPLIDGLGPDAVPAGKTAAKKKR